MNKIKLMPEYNTLCLWWYNNSENIGDLDYQDARNIGISDLLIKDIKKWHDIYYNWINWDNPLNEKYISEEEKEYFYNEGIELWKRLTKELEGKVEVVYYDEKYQRIFENIQDYVNYLEKLSWFNKTISN